ncbi:MAG: glycosyltransferase family 39 protein [Candidatus Levyibacteriota bacterium]
MKKKIVLGIFSCILLAAFLLRLYRINNPIGDWHAFRQADTSAVSKVYVEQGVDLLHPKYFDISNIQSGKDNPEGYRFVEFPIFNFFQVELFKTVGKLTLEEWGRLLSVAATLVSTTFIFLIVKKRLDSLSALFAAFFFAVLPYSLYYGRVILPDPSMAAAILGGIYFFDLFCDRLKEKKNPKTYVYLALSILFTAGSFLLKPFALFFTLPMLYIAWKEFGLGMFKKWQLYVFAALAIVPLVFWRAWITQYPEGIPVSGWLFNGGNIRFTGAYFYWIFAERIGKLMLGYFGLVLLFLGFFKQDEKDYGLFIAFLVSSLLYVTVIARGNVQHDYYQILILPTLCIFLGRGASYLLRLPSLIGRNLGINTLVAFASLGLITAFTLFFSWYYVRDYFNINNMGLVTAGKIADRVLPKDAKVIAANDGDTSFLYYINRKGWPAWEKGAEELKQMGATHIVIPTPTKNDFEGLGKQFKRYYSSPEVLILTL